MKQRLLILAAASAVTFAACTGGNKEGSYTQEQLDSITKVRTDSAANALKTQNDSLINAKANAEARTADSLRVIDSVINATKKSATKTTVIKKTTKPSKPVVKEEPKVEPKPEEPKKTTQQSKFENRQNGTKEISEEKKAEQKSKFDRRNN